MYQQKDNICVVFIEDVTLHDEPAYKPIDEQELENLDFEV